MHSMPFIEPTGAALGNVQDQRGRVHVAMSINRRTVNLKALVLVFLYYFVLILWNCFLDFIMIPMTLMPVKNESM